MTRNRLTTRQPALQRRSPTPHFVGVHPGGYDPQIRTRPRFLYYTMHLPPKFHHPTFTLSEVSVLTNKQTYVAENIQRSLLHWATYQAELTADGRNPWWRQDRLKSISVNTPLIQQVISTLGAAVAGTAVERVLT